MKAGLLTATARAGLGYHANSSKNKKPLSLFQTIHYMPDSIFCPKCGTPNQPDFMYCTSCGFALSAISKPGAEKTPPPYTAPGYNQPVAAAAPAKAASGMPRWLPAVIVIVVLAAIGFLIVNNEQSKKKNGSNTGLTNDNYGQDNTHISDPLKPTDNIKAKDFAGVWRPYESNDQEGDKVKLGDPKDDLFIEVSNGRVAMYSRSEIDEEDRNMDFTCDELVGNTISCIMRNKKHPDEGQASIKLEMQSSKNEMTVTISPQNETEKLIVKVRRLNETGN